MFDTKEEAALAYDRAARQAPTTRQRKKNLNFEAEECPSVLFVEAPGGRPWHWVEEESDWTPEDYCSTAPPPAKRQKTGVAASLPLADLVNRRSASSVLLMLATPSRPVGLPTPKECHPSGFS
jgi:hypothetical protein